MNKEKYGTMDYYSAVKKQWHLKNFMQMDGTREIYPEWNNPDPERGQQYYSFISGYYM